MTKKLVVCAIMIITMVLMSPIRRATSQLASGTGKTTYSDGVRITYWVESIPGPVESDPEVLIQPKCTMIVTLLGHPDDSSYTGQPTDELTLNCGINCSDSSGSGCKVCSVVTLEVFLGQKLATYSIPHTFQCDTQAIYHIIIDGIGAKYGAGTYLATFQMFNGDCPADLKAYVPNSTFGFKFTIPYYDE